MSWKTLRRYPSILHNKYHRFSPTLAQGNHQTPRTGFVPTQLWDLVDLTSSVRGNHPRSNKFLVESLMTRIFMSSSLSLSVELQESRTCRQRVRSLTLGLSGMEVEVRSTSCLGIPTDRITLLVKAAGLRSFLTVRVGSRCLLA